MCIKYAVHLTANQEWTWCVVDKCPVVKKSFLTEDLRANFDFFIHALLRMAIDDVYAYDEVRGSAMLARILTCLILPFLSK